MSISYLLFGYAALVGLAQLAGLDTTKVSTLVLAVLGAVFIGFVADQVVQHHRRDVTSRLSYRSRRRVARRINARWAGRSMPDPYRGPVPTTTDRSAGEFERLMVVVDEAVAELDASTAELRDAIAGGAR